MLHQDDLASTRGGEVMEEEGYDGNLENRFVVTALRSVSRKNVLAEDTSQHRAQRKKSKVSRHGLDHLASDPALIPRSPCPSGGCEGQVPGTFSRKDEVTYFSS